MTTTTPAPATTTPAPTAVTPTRTLGIISLVLGVASLAFGLVFIVPIAAIVLGVLALKSEPASRGFAIGGIVTGAVSVAGVFLAIVGALVFLPLFGILGSFGAWGWGW